MPGHDDGLVLDCDPGMQTVASAYRQSGTMEGWLSAMRPHRERNRFRFILAAAFAAPLLKLTCQRNFLIYNWGGSRGGKTAALLAGMSAWGDPEKLMISFDTTVVGLEHRAGLCCDLPIGIDEREYVLTPAGWKQTGIFGTIGLYACKRHRQGAGSQGRWFAASVSMAYRCPLYR